jgi:hypothetical protein
MVSYFILCYYYYYYYYYYALYIIVSASFQGSIDLWRTHFFPLLRMVVKYGLLVSAWIVGPGIFAAKL